MIKKIINKINNKRNNKIKEQIRCHLCDNKYDYIKNIFFLVIIISMNKTFNKNDYNSPDGMLTSVWGPALWHSLHTISFNYPTSPSKEDKENYRKYFTSLQNVLPCVYCRENFKENLKKLPLTNKVLKNRENLSYWLYQMHELINNNLEKKNKLSYEEVRDRYENFRARCLLPVKGKDSSGKEKGCTESLYGKKSKCVVNIVPKDGRLSSFKMDKDCEVKKK